jgi:hypothetical protein
MKSAAQILQILQLLFGDDKAKKLAFVVAVRAISDTHQYFIDDVVKELSKQ